jgi:hypothetical protein
LNTEPQATVAPSQGQRAVDRIAAWVLLAVMAVGSFALWLVVPILCLWAASKLTNTSEGEYLLGLPLTIAGVAVFAVLLGRLNGLYLRVTGVMARYEAEVAELFAPGEAPQPPRGPLEPLLVSSLVVALIAFVVWFFVFAKDPPLVPL